jgi:pimeloyl-ACP methyl ester carboxylesterase
MSGAVRGDAAEGSRRRTLAAVPGRTSLLLVAAALGAAACSSAGGVTQTSSRTADSSVVTGGDSAPPGSTGSVPVPPPTVDGSGSAAGPPPFDPPPIEWQRYNDAVDVGTVEVPVDYANPDGARFELYIARYNAIDQENRIGSLLVNPGGPGFGGAEWAFYAAQQFDQPLLERFDIVGWDPRGVGRSTPAIDCIDDYDRYFTSVDSTPDTPAERDELIATAQDFARECIGKNRAIIQHVGTNNSARDIDSIRRALGEDTISYFGFSYGSELGATWATLFPGTVRAAVFDGASDPSADSFELSLQQLQGFDAALTTFLARCSADAGCAFHNDGDAEGAFDALMAELDQAPIVGEPDRPPVNRDVALLAVQEAMYYDFYWPALEQSLAAAQTGDGSGLLALYDNYFLRAPDGTYGNELEAFQAISCADTPERPTVEEEEADAEIATATVPRLAPEGSIGFFCTFFPPALDPRVTITGAGAGPIVVIATTGDPATPFESTVRMADALEDGRLVSVVANQHTGYNVNRCIIDLVNDYLVDLVAPADDTDCG